MSGLLKKAVEKEQDEILRGEYLAIYPMMQTGKIKFLSFDEYKKTRTKIQAKPIEKEDIFVEMVALAQSTKEAK